jgi:hypothetical protein
VSFARRTRRRRARAEQPVRTLDLVEPIHVKGREIHQLDFYAVRARDVRKRAAGERAAEHVIQTMSHVTRLPVELLDELVLPDFEQAAEVLEELADQFTRNLEVLMGGN